MSEQGKRNVLLALAIMVCIGAGHGQELRPCRAFGIIGTIGGGCGVGFEYCVSIGSSTFGMELNMLDNHGVEGKAGLTLYPWSETGTGAFTSLFFDYLRVSATKDNQYSVGIDFGWKWMAFGKIDLHLSLGPSYLLNYAEEGCTPFGLMIRFGIGYSF